MPETLPALEHWRLLDEWRTWLLDRRYAPTTVQSYVSCARRFLQAHEGIPLEVITPEHVERYLGRRGFSSGSYLTTLNTLRPFFTWLLRSKRLVKRNPCKGADRPTAQARPRQAVMPEEFTLLARAAPCLEALLALHLAYYSGLRANELRHLKVGDIDLERRLIHVRFGKGSHRSGPRERWTILHPSTARIVRLWLWRAVKLNPDLWLMGETRRRRDYKAIRLWMDRSRKQAGLPEGITIHSLRHGFLKLLKLGGASLELAANLAGHDDLETTRRIYGRLTPTEMKGLYDLALKIPVDTGGTE